MPFGATTSVPEGCVPVAFAEIVIWFALSTERMVAAKPEMLVPLTGCPARMSAVLGMFVMIGEPLTVLPVVPIEIAANSAANDVINCEEPSHHSHPAGSVIWAVSWRKPGCADALLMPSTDRIAAMLLPSGRSAPPRYCH